MSGVKVDLTVIGIRDNGDGTISFICGIRSSKTEPFVAHTEIRAVAYYDEDGNRKIIVLTDNGEIPENIKNAPKIPFETVKAFLEGRTE